MSYQSIPKYELKWRKSMAISKWRRQPLQQPHLPLRQLARQLVARVRLLQPLQVINLILDTVAISSKKDTRASILSLSEANEKRVN